MDHDGDAREWMRRGPLEVVVMVRHAFKTERITRALRRALRRVQYISGDELTRMVRERCQDLNYAHEFGDEPLPPVVEKVTEPSKFVTVPVAAERLGVVHSTVVRWLLRGYLQGTQEAPPQSRWRIPTSEVNRLAREREGSE
jgi:hypothetical protein